MSDLFAGLALGCFLNANFSWYFELNWIAVAFLIASAVCGLISLETDRAATAKR